MAGQGEGAVCTTNLLDSPIHECVCVCGGRGVIRVKQKYYRSGLILKSQSGMISSRYIAKYLISKQKRSPPPPQLIIV